MVESGFYSYLCDRAQWKPWKASVKIPGLPAEIWTEYLPYKNLERCRFATPYEVLELHDLLMIRKWVETCSC
jgi:hypothetical protein